MKNKKIRVLMIVLLIIVAICIIIFKKDDEFKVTPNPVIPNNNLQIEDIEVSLEELEEYRAAFNRMKLYFESTEDVDYKNQGISSLVIDLKGQEKPFESLSCTLKDLNNDGIKELLIYSDKEELKNVIVSMYTLIGEERECRHILNSQTDYYFKLCENNVIKNELFLEEFSGDIINT